MATLTPEAKQLLSATIRSLRERLLRDLHDEADRRYRLSIPLKDAGLDEAHRKRRERLEAWLDERVRTSRPKNKKEEAVARERLLRQAVKEAAATLLNRIVCLRHLEALGLSKPAVVTGGWNSKGFREYREFAPGLTGGDDTEGYATLLQLVFDDLATELPGLFGDVGLTRLFVIPPAALREVIERLDDPDLASAWGDDTTLGWVYQYWNDPEREALDAKLNSGGKIEPHEIASKTQMFTERYMVEWLLQNSLGMTWLCICKKNGWTPDADRVLPVLDARRAEWRKKREAGEVALDALMPIEGELEEQWKYYVPQPIPAVEKAPDSIHKIKLLDPACGSGHFLVIAFDLLVAMYREEARHRGKAISDREIAESILENNLFGIDIDPRAIQIAAAGLYLKAKSLSRKARPRQVNLVAPILQLGNLPPDDPALVQLRRDLRSDAGIPEELTNQVVSALAGVDHLGSLLKVDSAVEQAIRSVELEFERTHGQGDLFKGYTAQQVKLSIGEAKATILDRLERFLAKHSRSEDLGLRLDGEQLAAGVRFVRIGQEDAYDIVFGNPPYQASTKLAASEYIEVHYPSGKADLCGAFLERSIDFARKGGTSAMLTMRRWLFITQFAELRATLLKGCDLQLLCDVDRGAFEEVPDEVLATVMTVLVKGRADSAVPGVALQPTPLNDRSRDSRRTSRKRAALLAQVGRHEFSPARFSGVAGAPMVYWWPAAFFDEYASLPKFGEVAPVRNGLQTNNNDRFLRAPWEVPRRRILMARTRPRIEDAHLADWVPYIKGSEGRAWFEPLSVIIRWDPCGLQVKVLAEHIYRSYTRSIASEELYFQLGVAFTTTGADFRARVHRFASVFGNKGRSVFHGDAAQVCSCLNAATARFVAESLNPGLDFTTGDVNRLPVLRIESADAAFTVLESAFTEHEAGRETSVEFLSPRLTRWEAAQRWAQAAIDSSDGLLPAYVPTDGSPGGEVFISFALGVALGRFGPKGEGILDEAPSSALPHGIIFLSAASHSRDLPHPSCAMLNAAWKEHGSDAAAGYDDLGDYLRRGFFLAVHKPMYENRPIYFPLSSAKKSFVAYASIHRWKDDTLQVLLADHLVPERRRLEGELEDLRKARTEKGSKGKAEKRFTEVQKLLEELTDFIEKVTEVAEKGPPQPDDKTPQREVDVRYVMDLDDGVMVNSAALWPLLEPQWKDPKKWWKELATAKGRKDYDWSHLAARYFPKRVEEKCHQDPSLAVAHKCFWRLWPAKAYAWELRLQDEIRPGFTIDEPGSDEARATFLAEHAKEAAEIHAAELKRRERKAAKQIEDEGASDGPLFEDATEEEETEAEAYA